MNSFNLAKRISFAVLLALILFISVGSINAGNVNDTMIDSNDDPILSIEDNVLLNVDGESEIGSVEKQKNQTELTSLTSKVYYGGNYEVNLIDLNTSESLANKTVALSINGVDYSLNTDSNGIAGVNLKLNPGSYLATACFAGDDDFNASNNLSGQVKVLNTIKAKDITKYYKGSKNYQATYLDSNGKVLKNKNVAITVNGKKYTAKTNAKGVASIPVNLKPGTYKITTSNPVTGEQLTTTFKILTTISASDLKKVKGDSKSFVVKFLKSNGNALAKQQVKIKINGKTYTYRTYSNGKLKLSFNNFKAGTYKVVCYNKDALSKTNTVKIFSRASTKITAGRYTFLTNDTKVLNIKFTTALDDDSKSGKTIKIYVGDKTYSKKTDSNGEISLKLSSIAPGLHTVLCDYAGNKFFKSSFVFTDLTILDTSNAEFAVNGTTSFGNYAGTPFGIVMTAGGVPLIQKTIRFNINGETHTNKTNIFGFVSVPVILDAGNYTISYKFSGDSKVNEASDSCNISVFERINTTLTCSYKSSYKDSLQTFNVYLKDSNGTPLAYEPVELIIGGETYKEITDADGRAVIKSLVPVGEYDFSVVFWGNNNYNFSSDSGHIKVTLSKYSRGINEKNAAASSSYLRPTQNCQVNDAKIKSLVKSLTKGLTSDIDKAKAIFHYVQFNIEYDYYFDTHMGAVETLDSRKGNGADQSHLLIAMFRAAGLKARYVHGYCSFYLSEKTYGHVWTQVLIDDTWICADPSDLANRFGSISAWNVNNYRFINTYRELPF